MQTAMIVHRVLVVPGCNGSVAGELTTASDILIAEVNDLAVHAWRHHAVGWNESPTNPDAREARILKFMTAHRVDAIVAASVAPALHRALAALSVLVFERGGISMHVAAVSAATVLSLVDQTRRACAGDGCSGQCGQIVG
jgi:hypothetical protein